ncbi:HD domain-containing protein [Vreelandella sulfidaeris]
MNIVSRAAIFAKAAHLAINQRRKYTDEPYHTHPFRVAEIVQEAGGTPEMIAAAYLHDVVEDTHVTIEAISEEFGFEVAALVEWVSDFQTSADGNRAARKSVEREKLASASPSAQTIKLADLIDNTKSIVEHDLDFATIYLQEKQQLLRVMDKGDAVLYAEAMQICMDSIDKVKEEKERRRPMTHRVYINGRRKVTVYSAKEAWDFIGKQPMGVCYEVRNADDEILRDFIPY